MKVVAVEVAHENQIDAIVDALQQTGTLTGVSLQTRIPSLIQKWLRC